mmetsp:Transcript_4154/g.10140  ORF Transcript_4154/g.10140 Transcript_4154/m.10140 type:complete len:292 (+) Transcript_4154:650-1525(+)
MYRTTTPPSMPSSRCRSTNPHRCARTASPPVMALPRCRRARLTRRASIAVTLGLKVGGDTISWTMCATRCRGASWSPPTRFAWCASKITSYNTSTSRSRTPVETPSLGQRRRVKSTSLAYLPQDAPLLLSSSSLLRLTGARAACWSGEKAKAACTSVSSESRRRTISARSWGAPSLPVSAARTHANNCTARWAAAPYLAAPRSRAQLETPSPRRMRAADATDTTDTNPAPDTIPASTRLRPASASSDRAFVLAALACRRAALTVEDPCVAIITAVANRATVTSNPAPAVAS